LDFAAGLATIIHQQPAQRPMDIPHRYELKYLIPEWEVDAVRRAIAPFCTLDPAATLQPNHQYGIDSLYLDTDHRDLYRISCERRARRWKVRIRRYDGSDAVFLEVKDRDHDMTHKLRARIPADGWAKRLWRSRHDMASSAERIFCERLERYALRPTLMVRYMREAWVSTVDSYARVTFDRRVACQAWVDWSLDADACAWLPLDGPSAMPGVPRAVVLELKCLTAVPRWIANVTRTLALQKTRFSKYCRGIERFFPADPSLGRDDPI
jgi:SPX domain protein involved in polyphosphate accumulation